MTSKGSRSDPGIGKVEAVFGYCCSSRDLSRQRCLLIAGHQALFYKKRLADEGRLRHPAHALSYTRTMTHPVDSLRILTPTSNVHQLTSALVTYSVRNRSWEAWGIKRISGSKLNPSALKRGDMAEIAQLLRRPSVFVSFASTDEPYARLLAEGLDRVNIPSFFAPRDIHGAMNFAVEIVRAISSCEAMVVLLSPSSLKSPHVRREVSLSIDERRILLPVAMPGTVYPVGFSSEWTYWLSAVQVMEHSEPTTVVGRLQRLLAGEHDGTAMPRRPHDSGGAGLRPSQANRRSIIRRGKGSPSTMLRAERSLVTLIGRESELARLEQWCIRDDDFDVRVVTAGAGEGKTRLALELAQHLRGSGWNTAFLSPTAPGADAALNLPNCPQLLVADYAETRVDQLNDFFTGLLEYGLQDKVRLLLLARSATDWWKGLCAKSSEIADLLAESTIQPLEHLTASRDVVESVYSSAISAFSADLATAPHGRSVAPYKKYETVLDILEDALADVLGSASIGTGLQSTDRLLSHERGYILATARAEGIDLLDAVDANRIAAILTLFGASDEDQATDLVGECNPDLPVNSRRRIARLFRRLYPGVGTYIQGLRPDALAEDLLAEVLSEDGRLPGWSAERVARRTPDQRRRAFTILARASTRHGDVESQLNLAVTGGDHEVLAVAFSVAAQVEDPAMLINSISQAVEGRPDVDARSMLGHIPDETVAMAELAANLARTAMASLPVPDAMNAVDVELAMACSNRFSDAGWIADAASSAEVAVDRLWVVAQDNPTRRVLGRALTNLSNRLWETGYLADAVAPAREAVKVLTAACGDDLEVASARNNLAFRLSEVDDSKNAIVEALEALRLCQLSANADQHGVNRTLGAVLNNLTCCYLADGASDRAFAYGKQAVTLRRTQAVSDRDRFLPALARTLANAAPAAAACGDDEFASHLITEARSLHAITGRRAQIFRFEEAESAAIHAVMLSRGGDMIAAIETADEARSHLESITLDLGALRPRLEKTLEDLLVERSSPGVAPNPDAEFVLRLPRLLEYRDL